MKLPKELSINDGQYLAVEDDIAYVPCFEWSRSDTSLKIKKADLSSLHPTVSDSITIDNMIPPCTDVSMPWPCAIANGKLFVFYKLKIQSDVDTITQRNFAVVDDLSGNTPVNPVLVSNDWEIFRVLGARGNRAYFAVKVLKSTTDAHGYMVSAIMKPENLKF